MLSISLALVLAVASIPTPAPNFLDIRGEVKDFELQEVQVSKGHHRLFALSNVPMTCLLYRGTTKIEVRTADGVCAGEFDSPEKETLRLMVIPLAGKDAPLVWMSGGLVSFKYHAVIF